MVQKKAKRAKAKKDYDRISRLPEGVIHHIFSFLDTRSVVQSSVLSRRWINTWKSHPQLDFESYQSPTNKSGVTYPDFVHRYLSDRDSSAEVSSIDLRLNSIKFPLLKEIIIYAMSHRTRNLNVQFVGDRQTRGGGFDSSLFKSKWLQNLSLSIALRINKNPTLPWDLPALTTLNLHHVTFSINPSKNGESKSFELFSQLTNLKTIDLVECRLLNIDTFLIVSSGLENLTMIDLEQSCEFVISAPRLSSFTYFGTSWFSLLAKDLHSLENVNIYTIYHRSPEKQSEVVKLLLNTFNQVSMAKFLSLNSDALWLLSKCPELLEKQPSPFKRLESLKFVEQRLPSLSVVFANAINYFRRSSPVLSVSIELGPGTPSLHYIYYD